MDLQVRLYLSLKRFVQALREMFERFPLGLMLLVFISPGLLPVVAGVGGIRMYVGLTVFLVKHL